MHLMVIYILIVTNYNMCVSIGVTYMSSVGTNIVFICICIIGICYAMYNTNAGCGSLNVPENFVCLLRLLNIFKIEGSSDYFLSWKQTL